ncbi:hypothetical protein B296_00038808 [Ensete ventricosum]|uniref:Uncharacterized protein n=1 Tax=Ensete ventricosum TaxID=4639 RepID=A0A426YWC1_ENSVE|nr:hypothetical protein B296_00038808 [Ensete ventricosum]
MRVRRSNPGWASISRRAFLLIQSIDSLVPWLTSHVLTMALVRRLWVLRLGPFDDQFSLVWSFECIFCVSSGRPLPQFTWGLLYYLLREESVCGHLIRTGISA